MAVLNELELSEAVASLGDGWSVHDGALHKRYDLGDFAAAMALANRVADAAEQADHHPDMLVGWGRLELTWVTHSEGGITDRDVAMARRSDELAG
ncbi:MAG TPA: 4a-hydroxytetrahydrobiopterin dehydratase [Gaiellales bacterium]|jgi:4a-hydroxytetrahydrobiopterin dehydratase|nr:4a-hydroxytetrahydrobiopterin dehydratase [Gaiellales bacterium]